MSVTHGSALRGNLAQAVLDYIDAGGAGILKIFNSSNTVLATVTLSNPSFSRSGAVLTLSGVPLSDTSADASGTADHFEFQNNGGTKGFGGTAGTSGTDMILDSTSFTAGQKFTINSCTYTAPV